MDIRLCVCVCVDIFLANNINVTYILQCYPVPQPHPQFGEPVDMHNAITQRGNGQT